MNSLKATLINQTQSAKHSNAVIFSVDEAYVPFACFVANQIIEKEAPTNFDICICLPDISSVPQFFLNKEIRFCEIKVDGIDNLPIHNLSIAAYHRFFLPKLFEQEYDYLLYLDADTYLTNPFISDLFKQDLSKVTLAAAPDIAYLSVQSDPKFTKKLEKELVAYLKRYDDKNHIYRNSGVLLINSSYFIDNDYLNRILTTAFTKIDQLRCHDQTALNMSIGNELQYLPLTMNWQSNRYFNRLIPIFSPNLIHFISEQKPWLGGKHLMAKKYYDEYASFLTKHFPNVKHYPPNSGYEFRKSNPKYQNPIHEWISRESAEIKQPIADWFYQKKWLQPNLTHATTLIEKLIKNSIVK